MYSGSDSTDAQSYNQWALNPSTYQNMANEQVDWAALAQQWIIMKEARPPVPESAAVSVPPNSTKTVKKDVGSEGGEAPMEVENESEDNQPQWNDGTGSGDSWKWQNQQQQPWNWDNSWNSSAVSNNTPKPPLLPTPSNFNQYNSNLDNATDNANYGYNSSSSNYQSGYWTSSGGAKVIKPHNKRYSKVNVPTTVANTSVPPPKIANLDAAKRKQLPAWIREGLEKMERDKLKQVDKERERQEKAETDAKRRLYEKNALEILKDTVKEQQIKSRFDSASEESEEDIEGRSLTPEIQQPAPPQPLRLTQEEMMALVRRTMTEILLKVTNREIYTICKEELERYEKKKKASDQRVSAPSGANLSARLGLGAYGESDSENSDANSDDDHSDAELMEEIKRKKAEFAKVERAIEEKLAEAEKRREATSQSTASSPINNDIKDSQVDAKTPDGSTSDNPRTIKRSQRNSSSTDSKESKEKTKYIRDSSVSGSSSSNENYRKSRSRSRSRDRDRKQLYRSESRHSRTSRRSRSSERRRRSRSDSRSRRHSLRRDYRARSRTDSRSRSRSQSRSYRRSRSARSTSRSRRRSTSRSYGRRERSWSRRRSRSTSRRLSNKRKRSRSRSSGRGKKSSHRH